MLCLNQKHGTTVIVTLMIYFSVVKPAEAIGTSFFPQHQQRVVSTMPNTYANRLLKPSKFSDIEPKTKLMIMMPSLSKSAGSVRTNSDLKNSQLIKKFVSVIRGGDDEKLAKSIISKSKVSEYDYYTPSINKMIKELAEVILTDNVLWRILSELEKPVPSSLFAEGFVPKVQYQSTPSAEGSLDSQKCYAHREGYNTPRSVSENFETKAVKKLYETSLKNPRVRKEYQAVKDSLREGVHPINLSGKSVYVSPTKVLVKKPEGRYLIDVSDTNAYIVGVTSRTNEKCMSKFKTLMNEMYNLDLKGY